MECMKDIVNRLRRVRGQIESIESRIAEENSCSEVIPQLLAIKGSVESTLQAYFEHSLDSCADKKNPEEMKAVIKTLIKNI